MRFNRVLPFVRRCSWQSRDIGLFLPRQKNDIAHRKGSRSIFMKIQKLYKRKMAVLLFYARVM